MVGGGHKGRVLLFERFKNPVGHRTVAEGNKNRPTMILPALVCEAVAETRMAPAIKNKKIIPGTLIKILKISTTTAMPAVF